MSRWHLYRHYLSWQLFPITWIAQLLLTKFWPNFLVALIFSHQNSFWHKNVLDPKFLGTYFLDPTFFRLKKVLTKLFWTQIFLTVNCFKTTTNITSHQPNLVLLSLALLSPRLFSLFYQGAKVSFLAVNQSSYSVISLTDGTHC